jgi:hypothetical protein
LAQRRLLENTGIVLLDITAKSGWNAFAPDKQALFEYKEGKIKEERYTELYIERVTYIRDRMPQDWEELKRAKKLALGCYCATGEFCHRHIFKKMAEEYLVEQGFEVAQKGEIQKEKQND